jgi:hypothetical protein
VAIPRNGSGSASARRGSASTMVSIACGSWRADLPTGRWCSRSVRPAPYSSGGLSGEAFENHEVLLDLLSCPRTTNLDDHVGAVEQRRGMGLTDRRRSEWLQIEPGERLGPELLFDGAVNDRGLDRRCGVLQLGQLCSIGR